MKRRIEKAVVLGAGTMGARIAAHIANAGLPVLLLDMVPAESLSPILTMLGMKRSTTRTPARPTAQPWSPAIPG